jgi:hypothetical protein
MSMSDLIWLALDGPTKPVNQEPAAEKALVVFSCVALILLVAWLEGSWI